MAAKKEPAPAVIVPSGKLEKLRALEIAPLPEALEGKVDVRGWMVSLFTGAPYQEPDPEGLTRDMLFQSLMAGSVEEILKDTEMDSLQDLIEDFPGSSTGPVRITDLYVATSDMEDGGPCYMILTWVDMATGEEKRASTGASILQRKILSSLVIGAWPIECQIVRDKFKDASGKFMLNLWPVD